MLFLFSFVLLTVVNLGCIVLIVNVLFCVFTMLTLVVSIVASSHRFWFCGVGTLESALKTPRTDPFLVEKVVDYFAAA